LSRFIAIGILVVTGFVSQKPESLALERSVAGLELTSVADPPVRIRVDPRFKYVGGQRFILRDIVDAEQHFFVEADAANVIKSLYWIQFERYVAGRDGAYAYDNDQPLTLQGWPIRAHVRRFTEPPAPDSDRRKAYELLERAGYVVPTPSTRVRLVHVPESNRRQEVMMIYLEPGGATDPTTGQTSAILRRATEGLTIRR
jgi:hypothetical protein